MVYKYRSTEAVDMFKATTEGRMGGLFFLFFISQLLSLQSSSTSLLEYQFSSSAASIRFKKGEEGAK